MKTKTLYIADDGKEFDNRFDCERHEKSLKKKKKAEEKEACEQFFLSIGIDIAAYTEKERNQIFGISYLVFDKYGEIKGIKTVGGGQKKRYGIECDFKWVSSSDPKDKEALVNWLEEKGLYTHCLSSFLYRTKAFYDRTFLEKLENLCWEVENGELVNTVW